MSGDKEIENQKEVVFPLGHPWRVFGFEVFLFSLSLSLGIFAGLRLKRFYETQNISPAHISLWQFLVYFLIATSVLLLVIYFLKFKKTKGIFLKILFLSSIGFGDIFFFGLWLPDILNFSIVAVLIFLLIKKPSLIVHNLAVVFAISGVGAGLGLSFTPEMVILLLLIFSIYDFIAVYKTKHMVKMAKAMVAHRAILGIIVPQKISDLQSQIKAVKIGGKFLILGGGDIVFPLIFTVSLIPQGILNSLIVAGFSLIGLLAGFLIFISKKTRSPMPALPPIALLTIVGYLLTRII